MPTSLVTPFSENAMAPVRNVTVYCEPSNMVTSRGLFFGDNPLQFYFPVLMVQLGLVIFFSGVVHFFLKPLGVPRYVSGLLGGIFLGRSGLGRSEKFYQALFPLRSRMVLELNEILGIIFFSFLIGIRIDVSVIRKAGRLSLYVGLSSFLLPLLITNIVGRTLSAQSEMEQLFQDSVPLISLLESMIGYHAISSILKDMKLLNSELGRLALASSTISSLCSWVLLVINRIVIDSRRGLTFWVLGAHICRMCMIPVIFFVFRPIMFWMIRRTPEGKSLNETYICAVTVMLLVTALNDIVNGLHPMYSSLLMGVIVPGGPPLGSGLENKLEYFVTTVLLPCFVINVGRKVNVYLVRLKTFGVVEAIVFAAFLGKVVGSVVPSLCSNVPLPDAVMLALLLNCQGFLDIQFFSALQHLKCS